jgi:photosystem II stability/assembly factor-like uncharacterized protein
MSDTSVLTGLNQRVWYVDGGVHPSRSPELLTLGKFSTDPSQSIGEAKKISAPDPNSFSKDIQVGTIEGSTERASLGISARSTTLKSILMGWKNRKCRVDFFALSGKCGNPQDFTEGGEKWVYFPDGRISDHGYEGFGAYGRDEDKETNETVAVTSEEYYEFLYMSQEQVGSAYTTREIYTVDVYTGNDCENCPDPCDRVLATMAGANATPGTKPVLLYSDDGGSTFESDTIDTLFSNEVVSDGCVIGDDIVYISNTSNSIHWSEIELVFDGTNTWSEVTSGFVAAKAPNAIWSVDARHTWIVGDGGYIYFCKNHKVEVEVQDAGVATTQNLNSVHAHDTRFILAVGNSNAVVYSKDGGETWKSVTGPAVGVNMGACWMWDTDVWFVGEGAGGTGKLWLTTDSGKTWTQKSLPATYVRIDKIKFISEAEGYLSARDGSRSYILRTITAGNEWVVLPQGKSATYVGNTHLKDIDVCSRYSNTAFAAGLATNGTAGIIVKMTN